MAMSNRFAAMLPPLETDSSVVSMPRCFTLSPSALTYLWDTCPRCFWLQAHGRVSPPRLPFPGVFSRIHEAIEDRFAGRCPTELDASLPTGRCVHGELHVASAPLATAAGVQVAFRGRVDHLLAFDDGTWGVVDYKTVVLTAAQRRMYNRQLHAYAWSLERAVDARERRGPVERLGLLCLEPGAVSEYARGDVVRLDLRPVWVPLRRADAAFQRFLDGVGACLAGPVPAAGAGCSVCGYVARRGREDRTVQAVS